LGDLEVVDGTEAAEKALRECSRNMAPANAQMFENLASGSPSGSSASNFGIRHLASAAHQVDYTVRQIHDQVKGFGCAEIEVGVLPPKHRPDLTTYIIRIFSVAQLLTSKVIRWLKAMNAAGFDIYCRPAVLPDAMRCPLVFVDDLSAEKVEHMRASGLPLAVLVESSPANFHGWVRVADNPISADEALGAARILAAKFGGDIGAIGSRQFGRMAGFTNKKQRHETSSGSPFAILRASTIEVAPKGPEFLDLMRSAMVKKPSPVLIGRVESNIPQSIAVDAFLAARAKVRLLRANGAVDESAADFGAVAEMIDNGWLAGNACAALLLASPGIHVRHRDAQGYAARTVEAAERAVAARRSELVPALRPRQ